MNPQLNFTDLDRARRQQAFIASLAYQLKQAGTFTNPARFSAIINVAKGNIAVDAGLDLPSLAQRAATLAGGTITFTTLPIVGFGTTSAGEDVNLVAQIQALVRNLIGDPTPIPAPAAAPTSPEPGSGGSATVDVVNATGRNGLVTRLAHALAPTGFTPGATSTARRYRTTTMVYYPARGLADAARTLAGMLGGRLPTAPDSELPVGHLRVILGTDFTMPAALGVTTTTPAGGSSPPTSTTRTPADPPPAVRGPPWPTVSRVGGSPVSINTDHRGNQPNSATDPRG